MDLAGRVREPLETGGGGVGIVALASWNSLAIHRKTGFGHQYNDSYTHPPPRFQWNVIQPRGNQTSQAKLRETLHSILPSIVVTLISRVSEMI